MRQVGLSTPTVEWCVCAIWDEASRKCLLKGKEKSGRTTSSQMTTSRLLSLRNFNALYIYCNCLFMAFQPHHMSVNTVRCIFMRLPKYYNQTFCLTWLESSWLFLQMFLKHCSVHSSTLTCQSLVKQWCAFGTGLPVWLNDGAWGECLRNLFENHHWFLFWAF